MVADELALELADEYVRPGGSVLDPFCGSGRLLVAAAKYPGLRHGMDVNPLACLLTRAKLARPDRKVLVRMLDDLQGARGRLRGKVAALELRASYSVPWFSEAVQGELAEIVSWINASAMDEPERLLVAAALSAATRDASFARKVGWKLHRHRPASRARLSLSAWASFERRLRYCVDDLLAKPATAVEFAVELADARALSRHKLRAEEQFDLVLTSPPYGDSRTTVQYGGASALCLDAVSRISGMDALFEHGRDIDGRCLGGTACCDARPVIENLERYWAASSKSSRKNTVVGFLGDYAQVCDGIASRLKPGGAAVLVVGRRSVGGFRVKLDAFTTDRFEALGLRAIGFDRRSLREKRLPRRVNRFGRSTSEAVRTRGLTPTMSSEIILAFRKPPKGRVR
jgi:DNA modification methylase